MSNMRNYKKETRKYNYCFFWVGVSGDTSSCFQSVMLLGLWELGETLESRKKQQQQHAPAQQTTHI